MWDTPRLWGYHLVPRSMALSSAGWRFRRSTQRRLGCRAHPSVKLEAYPFLLCFFPPGCCAENTFLFIGSHDAHHITQWKATGTTQLGQKDPQLWLKTSLPTPKGIPCVFAIVVNRWEFLHISMMGFTKIVDLNSWLSFATQYESPFIYLQQLFCLCLVLLTMGDIGKFIFALK